jgi:hypothetical protein
MHRIFYSRNLKERDNLEDLNLDGKNYTEMIHTENNLGEWIAFVAHDRYQWRTFASMMTKFSVPLRQKNSQVSEGVWGFS